MQMSKVVREEAIRGLRQTVGAPASQKEPATYHCNLIITIQDCSRCFQFLWFFWRPQKPIFWCEVSELPNVINNFNIFLNYASHTWHAFDYRPAGMTYRLPIYNPCLAYSQHLLPLSHGRLFLCFSLPTVCAFSSRYDLYHPHSFSPSPPSLL